MVGTCVHHLQYECMLSASADTVSVQMDCKHDDCLFILGLDSTISLVITLLLAVRSQRQHCSDILKKQISKPISCHFISCLCNFKREAMTQHYLKSMCQQVSFTSNVATATGS